MHAAEANSGLGRYGLDSSASSSSGSAPKSLIGDKASLGEADPTVPSSAGSGTETTTTPPSEQVSPGAGHVRHSTGLSVILPELEEEAQGLIQGAAAGALGSAGLGRRSRRISTPAAGSRTPSRFRAALRSACQGRPSVCFGFNPQPELLHAAQCMDMH